MPKRAPTLGSLIRKPPLPATPPAREYRGTAAERGYDRRWRSFRAAYLAEHPLCVVCGKIAVLVDHIKPLAAGGTHCDPENSQSLCTRCHNRKTGREKRPAGDRRVSA